MKWPFPIERGTFCRRYQRFFAECRLPDGSTVTAHCPNTGSMRTCLEEGAEVLLMRVNQPKRKLPWTWVAIRINQEWVGVHTSLANQLVAEALLQGRILPFGQVTNLQKEPRLNEATRLDLAFVAGDGRPWLMEIKNVTLAFERHRVAFPDSRTTRGEKHVRELIRLQSSGRHCCLMFCVQRNLAQSMTLSWQDDPFYAQAVEDALTAGVTVMAWVSELNEQEVVLHRPIPFHLRP